MADAASWTVAAEGMRVTELHGVQAMVLRLHAASAGPAIGRAIGTPLPERPNTSAGEDPRVLWLAPGEWALAGSGLAALAPAIEEACGTDLHHLADLAEGWAVFAIEGPQAAELIARGCSLDLHPRAFPAGSCAQSLLAQVPVLLDRPGREERFLAYVDRSLAAVMRTWVERAAAALSPAQAGMLGGEPASR